MTTAHTPSASKASSAAILPDVLLYVSRISAKEKIAAFQTVTLFQPNFVKFFKEAIHEIQLRRLVLASEFLELARKLATGNPDEMSLRASVSRAYYSTHHSMRTMVLHENEFDPDGHAEAITELTALLKVSSFCARSGLHSKVVKEVTDARDNRVVADYSPLDKARYPDGMVEITITNGAWRDAAKFNLDLADRMLVASSKVVGV